jgi:ElaB/YqjD/DUF883 family membrane-anchored ribosome-binding protein
MQTTNPTKTDVKPSAGAQIVGSKRKLASEFRSLVTDAEEFLRNAGGAGGAAFEQARARFEERIKQLKDKIPDAEAYAAGKYQQAVTTTDTYVRSYPWQAIGIAVAAGALIGFLSARRS